MNFVSIFYANWIIYPVFGEISPKNTIQNKDVSKITIKFITLGCKTNLYESEAMKTLFEEAGYTVSQEKSADIFVVNTCTVTGTGAKKSRQQIRRVRRENPNAILAVTGCLAQTEAEQLKKDLDIDVLLGNKHRNRIVELVEKAIQGSKITQVEDILKETAYEELTITKNQSRVRANLKIEDGCSNFCSYCIIPFARGPVRSRPIETIREEAFSLGSEGYGEVVLTGIHIGSYGKDLEDNTSLIDVIEAVHQAPGISRIRLGSLEPVMITEDFVHRAKKLPKLCPQFHLSLQSGCDATLSRMRRHYTAEDYRRAVALLRKELPDTAITTDLMVGFPGETEEEFQESYNFCKEIGFSQMHIFPYSIRKGTAAEKFPHQVPESVKADRTHAMLTLAAQMKEQFYRSYLGKTVPVLLEQKEGKLWHGTCANYMDILVDAPEGISGQFITATLCEYENEKIIAIPNTKEI